MVIDTSALLAILGDEPERPEMIAAIVDAPQKRISAGTYLETAIVLGMKAGRQAVRHLDLWLATAGIVVEPFDATHAGVALDAYFQYGKGKHPANLNYGDCFAYALAKQHAEPLLCKGADFAQTDIDSAQG